MPYAKRKRHVRLAIRLPPADFAMGQEPVIQLLVIVAGCPAIVSHVRVYGKLYIAAGSFYGVNHTPVVFQGIGVVLCTVEYPDGHIPQIVGFVDNTASAHRGYRCEIFRIHHCHVPCAVSAKARAGQVDSPRIDIVIIEYVVNKFTRIFSIFQVPLFALLISGNGDILE